MVALDVLMLSYGVTEEAGGPGVAAAGFARSLSDLGDHVELVALPRAGTWLATAERARSEGYDFRIVRARTRVPQVFELAFLIRRFVRRASSPVVWINGIWGPHSIAASLVCRRARVPYIVRPAGSLGTAALGYRQVKKRAYYAVAERHVLRHAAAIHCMSRVEVDELPGELKSHAFVVPSGVVSSESSVGSRGRADLSRSSASSAPCRGHAHLVGVLARLHPIKRQHLVLGAVERLCRSGVDVAVELAGSSSDDTYEQRLRSLVAGSEVLRGRVRFLGHVASADVPAIVRRWDAALLLSEQENFGHAVLMTCAAGVPAVLSRGVALAEAAEAAGAAVIVPTDESSVAQALRRLLESDGARAQRSRDFASSFGWDACAERLHAQLQRCVIAHQSATTQTQIRRTGAP